MIKFFRKIRQNLLNENKTGKYFKYAIGEIILVVIGILIAVWINGKYNDAQNEKKTQAILKQLQKELVTDIKDAKRIFARTIETVSFTNDILNDKVTPDVFKNDPYTIGYRYRYVSFSNKKTGYERFIQNLENLPKRYNMLLPYFNDLFREYQHELDDYNEAIKKDAINSRLNDFDTEPKNYLYYISYAYNDEEARTVVNDPYLKNKATRHLFYHSNISRSANDYRIMSIELYKKIDSLLGTKPKSYPDILTTLPKEGISKDILGEYTQIESENPATFILSIKENYLEMDHSEFGINKIFWNGDDYYFMEKQRPIIKLYKNKKGQQIFEDINSLNGVQVFIKTSDLDL
jgi:hypothetical protein